MDALLPQLRALSPQIDADGAWPGRSLELLADAGVYRWFVPPAYGGAGWSEGQLARGYIQLASACLTTAFVLTQRSAACKRVAKCANTVLKDRLLPDLAAGRVFATVGLSHLSTSRRHLGRPAVTATRVGRGFRLEGTTWWVTGAGHADYILVGADLEGDQILLMVPASAVRVGAPAQLVALTGSHTAAVHLDGVEVGPDAVVDGPAPLVFGASRTGGTGGLQTSSLATGLARAAARYIGEEAQQRPRLNDVHRPLVSDLDTLENDMVAYAEGDDGHSKVSLRARANALVLKSTQTALHVAKGAGYVQGRDPGRWCREALFFLVWSIDSSADSS